jgi:hypothetical protein
VGPGVKILDHRSSTKEAMLAKDGGKSKVDQDVVTWGREVESERKMVAASHRFVSPQNRTLDTPLERRMGTTISEFRVLSDLFKYQGVGWGFFPMGNIVTIYLSTSLSSIINSSHMKRSCINFILNYVNITG